MSRVVTSKLVVDAAKVETWVNRSGGGADQLLYRRSTEIINEAVNLTTGPAQGLDATGVPVAAYQFPVGVRSGLMRSTIRMLDYGMTATGLRARLGTEVFYARYVAGGTEVMPPRPFMLQAMRNVSRR